MLSPVAGRMEKERSREKRVGSGGAGGGGAGRDLKTSSDVIVGSPISSRDVVVVKEEEREHTKQIEKLKERITVTLQRTRDAIDSALEEAKRELDAVEEELGKQIDAIQAKEAQFEEEQADLIEFKSKLSHFASSSARVKLDIGGTRFVTTRQTLCKESSMLSAMLNFNVEPDEDGAYFIDRNPKYFEFLLEYLRSGQIFFLERLDPTEKKELLVEVEFYQIPSLLELLKQETKGFLPELCGDNIILSKHNRRAKKVSDKGWDAALLATRESKWSVKLVSNCAYLMIGVAPPSINKNGKNFDSKGCYFCTADGKLYAKSGVSGKTLADSPGACYNDGTIIDCWYDQEKGEFSVAVNSKALGVIYTGLPGNLHPAFDCYDKDCEFEIIV